MILATGLPAASAAPRSTSRARANVSARSSGNDTLPKQGEWDSRIVEFVQFVEKARGLKFEHPIPVDFLSDKKFLKVLHGDDHKPTKAERTAAEHYAGQLRALGLVEGDVDLIDANEDLDAASVTGFYSDRTKRMVIRGTDIDDVITRVTVVHELTHALQDQRFDLHRLDNLVRDSGQDFALTALIEGDARFVEEDYYFSLTPDEQDEYDNWDPGDGSAPDAPDEVTSAGIPPVLDIIQSAPYAFGLRFIEFLDSIDRASVDRAFSNRPMSEENIIDPVSYQLHEDPVDVAAPQVLSSDKEKADGEPDVFGAFTLYMVLASRIDPTIALAASEGWGGDRYQAFRNRNDKECVRIAIEGDTPSDSAEIGAAFDSWAGTMPAGSTSVAHGGHRTTVTACESTATAPTIERFGDAMSLLVVRNELLTEVASRTKLKSARCVADKAATDPALVPLFEKATLTADDKSLVSAKVRTFLSACGT